MAIIKCKMCGGDVELAPDKTFGTCDYCGSTMTFPKVDDEQRAAAFNRGNHFRRIGEFDKALAVYERIVAEDDTDAEAHWCCALCRFGIEYVEDPTTYEYIPTCHRASFDSILEDVDYLAAVEYSDGITRRQYQKDAAKIAEVQRGILATSQHEEPFDVFICYKETDNATRERTRDSLDAQEIYYQLTEKGYRVFFARITLEDKAGSEYEPYIFAALQSARVMIALGSKPEHFNAVWVKNEWSRFLSLMKKDRTKLLLPCYRGMDPYDLPEQLSVLQSYDMGKIGFMQDLIRGVEKVLRRDEPKPVIKETVVQTAGGPNVAAQIKRGQQALEDRDWEAAQGFFDKALDMDAECAEAFFGKALAEARCVNGQELVAQRKVVKPDATTEHVACPRDEERISAAVVRHESIPGYYEVESAKNCFSYDERTYPSYTEGWQEILEAETTYWTGDRNLSRAVRYAKDDFSGTLRLLRGQIEAELKRKLEESKQADVTAAERAEEAYQAKLDEADAAVERMYAEALARRKAAYEKLCQRQDEARTSADFAALASAFAAPAMEGFEDCDRRADLSGKQAEKLKAEEAAAVEKARKEREEAERLEQERKAEEERITAERAANKRKKTISIIAPIAVACVAVAIVLVAVILPKQKLNNAMALLDSGDYDAAYALLEQMGRDEEIISSKYDRALALLDSGDYEMAYQLLKQIDKNDEIEAHKYNRAVVLLESGDYEAAYVLLEEIGKTGVIAESKYNRAVALIDSGDVDGAYQLLDGLYWKDSEAKITEIETAYPVYKFKYAVAGDMVTFGTYEQDNRTNNGKENIEWIVLAKEHDKVLIISKYALDYQPYHSDHLAVTWETSSLRKWLNETFVSSAFSSDEQGMIERTTVSADKNPSYDTPAGNSTTDKVFLLSITEVDKYLGTSKAARQCQETKYANAQNIFHVSGYWWLRTPGSGSARAARVDADGSFYNDASVTYKSYIRPALWISLEP